MIKTNHKKMIAELKDRPCTDCLGRFPTECMHFDHVPELGPKTKNISSGWHDTDELLREIAKCELVCANCHAIRTKSRGMTADQKRRITEGLKRHAGRSWQDPQVRARRIEGIKKANASPETKEKRSKPRGPMSETTRQRIRDAQMRSWYDPQRKAERMEKLSQTLVSSCKTPLPRKPMSSETKAKISAKRRAYLERQKVVQGRDKD